MGHFGETLTYPNGGCGGWIYQGLLSIIAQIEDHAQEALKLLEAIGTYQGNSQLALWSYILSSGIHCNRHCQREGSEFDNCLLQCNCSYVRVHLSVLAV